MTEEPASARTSPDIAVIVVSDRGSTIVELLRYLRAQTVSDRVELVVATPNLAEFERRDLEVGALMELKVVEIDAITPLSVGRAAAVQAASAPYVFLGETHSFPAPAMLEKLLAAHAAGWDRVSPVFTNANPNGCFSWAAFLLDYGVHAVPAPAGEVELSVYNCSYRRSILLSFGAELNWLLEAGSPLNGELRRARCRSFREAAAQIAHTNVGSASSFVQERFLVGRNVGARLSRTWSRRRRALYVLGSPLIPAVLAYRTLQRVPMRERAREAPRLTLATMLVGLIVRAAGEAVGYAVGAGQSEHALDEIEIHKLEYA